MHVILDLEGNGLREDITEVHCIVAKSVESSRIYRFYNKENIEKGEKYEDYPWKYIKNFLERITEITGHNIIAYDAPVIKKFFGVDLFNIKINDTYVWSNILYPDRSLPEGCPTSTSNPLTGNQDKIGPHSLEALGWPLGYRKIHHHDWRTFSKEMLERCTSDVEITEAVYYDFLKEINNGS